ncbi:helix-turn-helix domain-containing protein [Streptomyces akebiae]|uniref:Helix-turn-helix domain-containing protein n=1 Tax=Streptomyces akebiae TaxID=2865673 RepID=A0ABX8XLC3_9ACTN|nr:helix-turn-helix domain-containing protein [Streptomyces akebiae]QYX76646.1 helix-turn-helix domain-containing protein [Streptomyces akebiae]
MKGLLLRLSALDADAENAVRVIGFFDQLISSRASLSTLVKETAKLAECPAGAMDSMLGVCLRADPAGGQVTAGDAPPTAASRPLAPSGQVWLERAGTPLPLDELVLERFAIAAAPLLDHSRGPMPELGDTALVELVLSAAAGEAERSRAVRLLHFEPTTRLRVLAVAAEPARVKALVAALREISPGVHCASLGPVHAVLTPEAPPALPDSAPRDIRIGVGPALPVIQAADSWQQARTALRFTALTAPYPAVFYADELGAMAALAARMRTEDIAQVADVTALDRLASEPHGADTLAALTAFCSTGSARKAAAAVYRHHSTVAARLAHAESRLGFAFATPAGRLRLELAIVLRHLRDSTE